MGNLPVRGFLHLLVEHCVQVLKNGVEIRTVLLDSGEDCLDSSLDEDTTNEAVSLATTIEGREGLDDETRGRNITNAGVREGFEDESISQSS